MHKLILFSLFILFAQFIQADDLPSWNEGDTKDQIIRFVHQVTTPGSDYFVPLESRIAVFDNDGTLWSEKPYYFQLAFALDHINKLAPDNPQWQNDPILKAAMERDIKAIISDKQKSLIKIIMTSHTGISTKQFQNLVLEWIYSARHPDTNRLYIQMVYQPMLELLTYLRSYGFQTWIVSGGGIDFMRAWSEEVYGIIPEQVIGSSVKIKYELLDGTPTLMRQPEINFVTNKSGKPIGIHQHIGLRPIAAFGNSDGDLQMLQWTTTGHGARLGVIIHHTDKKREYAYDRHSRIGRLDKALTAAKKNGWTIVDMKNDWKTIYPKVQKP